MTAPYTMRVILPRHPNLRIEFLHVDDATAVENDSCQPSRPDQNSTSQKATAKHRLKCLWCRNQPAKNCANACCGQCCRWGAKPCEKHGMPEREDSGVVLIDSSCLDQDQPAEKRTKHGVMCLKCKNQASQWCANDSCRKGCRGLGVNTCIQHGTRGQEMEPPMAKTTASKPDDAVSRAVDVLIENALQAAHAKRVAKPSATP